MKINGITILNWKAPGEPFWIGIEARPDEPLIEARLDLTLSFREYHALLAKDEKFGKNEASNQT